MLHTTTARFAFVTLIGLVSLGVLGGGALGQVASPVAVPPVIEADAVSASATHQAYIAAMHPIMTSVEESLVRYTSLAADPQFHDRDWLEKFAFELMLWRSAQQDALAITPPPVFAASHGEHLAALGLLAATSDDIYAAVNDNDLAGLMQAWASITSATRRFDQATVVTNAVNTEQGGMGMGTAAVGATPVASLAANTVDLLRLAGNHAASTPPVGSAGSGQVNVMVEVNTYVGLGDLSTGEHTFQLTQTGECEGAKERP